jgi:predicted metalloprotease with PDZ domain
VSASRLQAVGPEAAVGVSVDLTDASKRVVHTRLDIPAPAGKFSFHYPKWIPGTHGPVGPISEQAGLKVRAQAKEIPWTRDDADPYTFHVTVPPGAGAIEVSFDLILQPPGTGSWLGTTLTTATPKLAVLNWNEVVVYPKNDKTMKQGFLASVTLPEGWKYGTALSQNEAKDNRVTFKAVPLEELIDSPLLCGEYLKEVPIGPTDGPKHRVVMACDRKAGLELSPETKASWDRLVVEAEKLFGVRHYRHYTFLLALSDQIPHFGLEHHESSDNRMPENGLKSPTARLNSAALFPHEFVHSWNGKYRRPEGMIVPDYQKEQKTRLLWVYEGLTNYLGVVLTGRSGLLTPEEMRDLLATTADRMAQSRGRRWRPLDDTAAANFVILPAPAGWTSYRRSLDYYDEGTLLWLEVDVIIRRETKGAKSLDHFCKIFFAGHGGKPAVESYDLNYLVKALDGVAEYDWKAHFNRRVSAPTESPPLDGLTEGGWKLKYTDKPSAMFEAGEDGKTQNLAPSIGLLIASDGKVSAVIPESPAAKAGIAPGVKLHSVNERRYSVEVLRDAVAETKDGIQLALVIENGEFVKTHKLNYKGGLRYPALERATGKDVIADIFKPLAPPK